jgi:hypothetical protein
MKKINIFIFFIILLIQGSIKSQEPICTDTCISGAQYTAPWTFHDVVFPINQYYNLGVRYSSRCGSCNWGPKKEISIDAINIIKNGTGVFPDSSAIFPEIYDKILCRILLDFQGCQPELPICIVDTTIPEYCQKFIIRFRISKCWRMYFDEVDTNVKSYRVCLQDKCCIQEYHCAIWRDGKYPNYSYRLNRSATDNMIVDSGECVPEYGSNCFEVCNFYFKNKRHDLILVPPAFTKISIQERLDEKDESEFNFAYCDINSQIVVTVNNESSKLRIFDFIGREINMKGLMQRSSSKQIIIDTNGLINGSYYLVIDIQGKIIFTKKFFIIK